MPRLLLLRHAKSSWEDTEVHDFDRPLNTRGRHAAALMGRHCAQHTLIPQSILCSSARRTRETLAGIIPNFAEDLSVEITRNLYMTAQDEHLDLIHNVADSTRTLMVIGHNPIMRDLALGMIGSGNPLLREEIDLKFPTAAVAVIDFDVKSWRDIGPGNGRIVAFFRPRELFMIGSESSEVDD